MKYKIGVDWAVTDNKISGIIIMLYKRFYVWWNPFYCVCIDFKPFAIRAG